MDMETAWSNTFVCNMCLQLCTITIRHSLRFVKVVCYNITTPCWTASAGNDSMNYILLSFVA
jgi:hypothetical protein